MASVWGEIKRRKVFQVAAVYAVVAWLIIQVVDVVSEPLNLPDWFDTVAIVFLAIGFPVAVILAWAFDLTPQGIKSASEIAESGVSLQVGGQALTYITHGLVLLAVGFLVVDQYLLQPQGGVTSSANSLEPSPPATVLRTHLVLGVTEPITGTELSADVALSRDGTRLAYAAQTDGEMRLYVRDMGQFEARALPGTEGAEHPFFAPDGESVVFFTDTTDEELKKISVRGGPPQTLARARLSGGGSWVTDDAIIFGGLDEAGVRTLFQIPAMGGIPVPLVTPDPDSGHTRPEVLPGGNAVLYVIRPGRAGSGAARDGTIALMSLESGETRNLISGGYAPRYSPTGHIVFARASSLWAVPFDLERLEIVGLEVPVVEGVQQHGGQGSASYAFSDDGLLVYAPGGDTTAFEQNELSLVWVDRAGREDPLDIEPRAYSKPSLSPDGQRVALTVEESDIWIHDLARTTSSRLTFQSGSEIYPIWTPDGERVAFSTNGGGSFWKSADGTGQVTPLTVSESLQRPESISPDGTQLIFRSQGPGQWDLYVQSLQDDGTPEPLIATEFAEHSSEFSPDGRWIAYVSDETGENEVFVRPFPNVDDGKWLISSGGGEQPHWGPEGRELFYRASDGVWAVPVESDGPFSVGIPTVLFTWSDPAVYAPSYATYDVSPDGQRFLMMRDAEPTVQESRLTLLAVVDDWFEELNRLAPREN